MSIEKNYNDNVENPSEDRLILPSDVNFGYEELEVSVPGVRPKFTYNGVAYKSVVDLIKSEITTEQPATEEESTGLVDKVAVLCTEQLSQTRGPQRTRLKKHKPTESK